VQTATHKFSLEATRFRLAKVLEENLLSRGEIGAGFSIWYQDRCASFNIGRCGSDLKSPLWNSDTLALVWSATKGPAVAAFLHLLGRQQIDLSKKISSLWPEFGVEGKKEFTLEDLLTHRIGLPGLPVPPDVFDHAAVARALAKAKPWWSDRSHGYHPRTFGYILDELTRRITGKMTLGQYWNENVAKPLGLEFYIGLPPELHPRAASMLAPRTAMSKEDPFFRAFMTPGTLTSLSFATPRGLHSALSMNTAEARSAELPAFGGIGTAESLATFYGLLATDVRNGSTARTGLPLWALRILADPTPQVSGPDRVLLMPTAFTLGFMRDPLDDSGQKLRQTFGPSPHAFGHPGAGGSVAFADPERGIGFAYVMNQMEAGVLPNRRAIALIEALYEGT
jgi:CubicO group peptidase (beta-lactamase class C family)